MTITFKINETKVEAQEGEQVLEVALRNGYEIPTLCYHESVNPSGACRLCLVEVKKGKRQRLTTACNYPVQEGIEVLLDTPKVEKHRKMVLELMIAHVPNSTELNELAARYGVTETRFPKDNEDCILCGLCERVCTELVEAHAITFAGRGDKRKMVPPFDKNSELCIGCGACVYVCPVSCIKLIEEGDKKIIDRWGRELQMIACKVCGYEYMPAYQAKVFAKRTGLDEEFFHTCPSCR